MELDKDIKCPYCGKEQNINHDDGNGCEEDIVYSQECSECGKVFAFRTSIYFSYEAKQSPCMNGEPHKWVESNFNKNMFEYDRRCEWCDKRDTKWRDDYLAKLTNGKYHNERLPKM